jgi:hypothetical protein
MDPDRDESSLLRQITFRLCNPVFGSVWRIREDLWQETLPNYDPSSRRLWHPGVSLLNPIANTIELDWTPMLYGSTGQSGPVLVRGLTEEKGPNHPTSFGIIATPAPIGMAEFGSRAPDSDPGTLTAYLLERKRILYNWHKPRLAASELEELEQWAKTRGWI